MWDLHRYCQWNNTDGFSVAPMGLLIFFNICCSHPWVWHIMFLGNRNGDGSEDSVFRKRNWPWFHHISSLEEIWPNLPTAKIRDCCSDQCVWQVCYTHCCFVLPVIILHVICLTFSELPPPPLESMLWHFFSDMMKSIRLHIGALGDTQWQKEDGADVLSHSVRQNGWTLLVEYSRNAWQVGRNVKVKIQIFLHVPLSQSREKLIPL